VCARPGPGGERVTDVAADERPEQSSVVPSIPTLGESPSVGRVPSYLVETYLARGSRGERAVRERRARSAAEQLTREGTRVSFAGSTHVPEDEMCFFTFDAPSSRAVVLAAERAGLDALRVVEAVSSGKEETA